LEVYPSHGEGSLCGGGLSAKPSTTLGYERLSNPMLKHADYEGFKRAILSNLPMRPQSFSHIIPTNMKGPPSLPLFRDSTDFALSADEADKLIRSCATLLDLRDAFSFGAAHIPGSINVDFSDGPKLNWLGVATPPGVPLVLILPSCARFEDICLELERIGYDGSIKGWLRGGMDAWLSQS